MTSYVYNPSKKVVEILGKFFEFDPAQLELGIWSGDLSLTNVNLRQDAIHPLLNKNANKPHTDPLKKAPLHMKLVSGTVGHMRIRIPWKRLVWGQGAVQLEISDVMIVLSLQSREESEAQQTNVSLKTKKMKKKAEEEESIVSKPYREAKQRRLREAERRHLQGMPVALYLDNVHRKNSIERDAAKAEGAQGQKAKPRKGPGPIDRWLKNAGSDIFWRFFAGIQGSIKNARIVVVQDGVEVGCVVQSIDVVAGKDGTKVSVNMGEDSDISVESMNAAEMSPPENFVYESAYDDGEHVDKTIKQQGMGIFIRKEASMAKVPQALRFSTSVSAGDYILRPVDLDLSFSFFYPYPPERRKKRAVENQSQDTPTTAASTSAASVGVSISDSTTNASSKRRRGKRERISGAPAMDATPTISERSSLDGLPVRGLARSNSFTLSSTGIRDRRNPLGGASTSRLRSHRKFLSEQQGSVSTRTAGGRPQPQLYASGRSTRSGVMGDYVHEPPSVVPDKPLEPVPKFDCRLSLKEIRIVFSTRHYELLNYFLSTAARMKNGKPDHAIRSVRERDLSAFNRKVMADHPTSPKPTNKSKGSPPSSSKLKSLIAPLIGFRGTRPIEEPELDTAESASSINFDFRMGKMHSAKSEIVVKWWKYAMGAILWEVRKRKRLTTNFREMYISFDWKRQRYKRQEYIDLYIAVKLDKKTGRDGGVWRFEESHNREEELLRIEDELRLEQLLLYRSIARSVRVRGMTKMPASICDLHTTKSMDLEVPKNRRSSLGTISGKMAKKTDHHKASEDATLLSLIQDKFDLAKRLRLKGGVLEKMNSSKQKRKQGRAEFDGDGDGEVLSSDAAPIHYTAPSGPSNRRSSIGYDSTVNSESGGKTPRRPGGRTPRKGSVCSNDIQAGNFYASGSRRDSQADGRTVQTYAKGKESKHVRSGYPASKTGETVAASDRRMRFSFSLQVKCIDIMIVEEAYNFDKPPQEMNAANAGGRLSPSAVSRNSGEDSSDDFSDLSVLTDDERFFNEEGHIEVIAEEEEDEAAARLSSTDFLLLGLPENPLLRLTITSLGSSFHGRSGGPMQIGLSIRRISAVGEDNTPILSMGPTMGPTVQPCTPIPEVNVGGARLVRAKSFDSIDPMDLTSHADRRQEGGLAFGHERSNSSGRAVSLMLTTEDASKTIQCDFSRIGVTVDLNPAVKLLGFYSTSEIRYPDKILEKSSRDVARKFMIYKTAAQSKLGTLSTSIRVHGLEIKIPFCVNDSADSEASELNESNSYDNPESMTSSHNSSLVFVADTFEVYSGMAVDEICEAVPADLGQSVSNMWNGSFTSKRDTTVKTLEMLDIAELTSSHDSFACTHWVRYPISL
jgi:hypothetical protein